MRMMIEGVNLPRLATVGSCGYDVFCPRTIEVTREPVTIDLGILMEAGDIQEGCFAMLLPRSSTGAKAGLHLRNSMGIIDSSYTMDTIKATLYVDAEHKVFFENDRILQMVIVPYAVIQSEIPPVEERKGGYGSTGA